ncbi:MAG: EamA family transporter [Spirochaetes bacterium]|nr:EamA family transporter [Spirochaetota bacterium]
MKINLSVSIKSLPYMAVITGASLGALTGVFVKTINLPITSIAFFRMFIPSLVLFLFFVLKRSNPFRGNYKTMLAASLLNAVRMFFFYLAFTLTSIGNAVIMLYTWPILVTVLAFFVLGEKQNKTEIFLIIGSFAGIVLTYIDKEISFKSRDFLGMASMVLCSMIYAVTMVIFKKETDNYSKLETVFFQNLIGGLVFLPFIIFNRPAPVSYQLGLGILLGLLVGIGAFLLFFYALNKLKISHYSVLAYFEVIAAFVLSTVLFHEKISWNMYAGAAIIISTGYMLQIFHYKEKNHPRLNKI